MSQNFEFQDKMRIVQELVPGQSDERGEAHNDAHRAYDY